MTAKQIMVIEDDFSLRVNMQKLLEGEGYRVVTAENGRTALDRLTSEAELPALIILDLMMPVMDGFEFRVEQVKQPTLIDIPVIIMSAGGNLGEKQMLTRATFALRKPADIDAILDAVLKYAR